MSFDRQFDEILNEGIIAARSGNRRLAQSLLNQAAMMRPTDSRPFVWLSATTDDVNEQIDFLEQALACNPQDVNARRGLAILKGKVPAPQAVQAAPAAPPEAEVEAKTKSFKCPKCGGNMTSALHTGLLTCDYCGFVQDRESWNSPHSLSDSKEQVMDYALLSQSGHGWARTQHLLSCENCGAVSTAPAGQKSLQCSYCGSNQLVEAKELGELIDPQIIVPIKIKEQDAMQNVKKWLGSGLFTPDNLLVASRGHQLRPAYYSCWTFDGTVEVNWSCEVAEDNGRSKTWRAMNGSEVERFNDILISGVKALSNKELASIEPFDLINVEEFKPDFLAGWPTMIYDRPLSEASLIARERVLKNLRPQLHSLVEPGREKRNLRIGSGKWSDMTYKHVVLPVWLGTYHYQGKEHHLLVNGQTGKVGGFKPRDSVKVVLAMILGIILMLFFGYLFWMLLMSAG